jgi:hypothetical protein
VDLFISAKEIEFSVVQSEMVMFPEAFSDVLSFEFVGDGAIVLIVR